MPPFFFSHWLTEIYLIYSSIELLAKRLCQPEKSTPLLFIFPLETLRTVTTWRTIMDVKRSVSQSLDAWTSSLLYVNNLPQKKIENCGNKCSLENCHQLKSRYIAWMRCGDFFILPENFSQYNGEREREREGLEAVVKLWNVAPERTEKRNTKST